MPFTTCAKSTSGGKNRQQRVALFHTWCNLLSLILPSNLLLSLFCVTWHMHHATPGADPSVCTSVCLVFMCHSMDIFVEREPTKPSTILVWKCNLGVCVYTTGSNWGCTKAWRCIWVCWMMRCGQWQLSTHWQHVYHMIMTSARWKQLSSRRSLCSNLWLSSSLVEETHLCTSWSHFWKSSRSCFFSLTIWLSHSSSLEGWGATDLMRKDIEFWCGFVGFLQQVSAAEHILGGVRSDTTSCGTSWPPRCNCTPPPPQDDQGMCKCCLLLQIQYQFSWCIALLPWIEYNTMQKLPLLS